MDTRTTLLDCAETAARQHDYDGFSYADLARDVGIRKASIHYHFPTKADLVFELTDRYASRFSETLSDMETDDMTAAERLLAYHQIYRQALAGGSQLCLCVALSAGRDSLADRVLARLDRFHKDSIAWLTRTFTEAQREGSVVGLANAEDEALATLALMEGAQLLARPSRDITLFDRATAAFLGRIAPSSKHQEV